MNCTEALDKYGISYDEEAFTDKPDKYQGIRLPNFTEMYNIPVFKPFKLCSRSDIKVKFSNAVWLKDDFIVTHKIRLEPRKVVGKKRLRPIPP